MASFSIVKWPSFRLTKTVDDEQQYTVAAKAFQEAITTRENAIEAYTESFKHLASLLRLVLNEPLSQLEKLLEQQNESESYTFEGFIEELVRLAEQNNIGMDN